MLYNQIFIDFSVEANNTLIYQLSDFVDLEFGNYNATTGQPNNLFITSQRSDRVRLPRSGDMVEYLLYTVVAVLLTSRLRCLRAQQIELFNADGKYLGPFLVGKEDGTTISEPQNLFFHSCPVLSYPQMNSNSPILASSHSSTLHSPSLTDLLLKGQNTGKSEGFNIDLLLGLLVPLMAILILLVFVVRTRTLTPLLLSNVR